MQLFGRMETRRLENKDMQSLVRIFRDVPFPCTYNDEAKYNKITKREIKSLPHKLRSLRPSSARSLRLCNTHKNLDHCLIKDIWSWIRHELEGGIGRLLYPLIMCDALTPEQELQARQLEPVIEMWRVDWNKELSAPPGRAPIETHNKWKPQRDGCSACMLARIGSDVNVLFALMAGMAGRMHRRSRKKGYEDINQFRKVTHKRIRFVRYWLMTYRFGERRAWEAWKFGREMNRLRKKWKDGFFGEGTAFSKDEYDFNKPIDRLSWSAAGVHDAKLGPLPRPLDVDPTTPAEVVGLNVPSWRDNVVQQTPLIVQPQPHLSLRGDMDHTNTNTLTYSRRNDSAHDMPPPPPPPTRPRPNAFRPSSSIYSRPSGFVNSSTDPNTNTNTNTYTYTYTYSSPDQANPFSDPSLPSSLQVPAMHPSLSRNPYAPPKPPTRFPIPSRTIPPPRPQSLYSAYADPSFDDDAFAHADVSPPLTPSRESWDRERDRIMGFGDRDGGGHHGGYGHGDGDGDVDRRSKVGSVCTTWGQFCGK